MTPFVITAEGDIDNFAGGKMEVVYQVDDQHLTFLEEQAKKLNAEKNQSIITGVLCVLMGSRHKMRRRHVTGLPPMPVTVHRATPISTTDAQPTATPPVLVDTVPEPLMLLPITEAPVQPPIGNNQLGGLYITDMQVHHDNSNMSVCSLDTEPHDNLKSHFNERLNDKVYSTFKKLFSNVNIDSIKEVLPKISIYNDTIARYVEDINLRYGITLSYMHLEVSEVGHRAETFQVATCSKDQPEPCQPQQPQQQTLQVTTATQDQSAPQREQQTEIDRLTNMTVQWLTGE